MRRKISIIVIATLISTFLISGCTKDEAAQKYEQAITALNETTLNEDGIYTVTEDLVIALQNAEYTEPKSIIYMIGDGMGANIIQATQEAYADELYGNKLAINYLTNVGTQSTYSADTKITDSAAGGTALATGRKTSNYTVAMNKDHMEEYKTVLELAAEKDKSTGIVVTKSVTDATPATFTSHVVERNLQTEIARQQLEKMVDGSLDIVLGGGYSYYEDFKNADIFREAKSSGVSYSRKWMETLEQKLPLVGLYAPKALNTTNVYTPTLAEMTDLALQRLSEDEDGFFLMVEGSQIDTKAHSNKLKEQMYEMYQFDSAIAVAMKYVALHPDTVIIVTADHETGGLYFPQEGYTENGKYRYLSEEHTSINVPVYAVGHGTDALGGIMENTDIADFVAGLLGEDGFAQKSEVVKIFDADKSESIKMSFDKDTSGVELLTDALIAQMKEIQNARAIHLRVHNFGEELVTLPALRITCASNSYEVVPQGNYIDAGDTLELSYILPVELWQDNAMTELKSIQVSYDIVADNAWKADFSYNSENAELEILKILITERMLEK